MTPWRAFTNRGPQIENINPKKIMTKLLPAWMALMAALAAASSAQAVEPLRVGINSWPGYQPLRLADEIKGWEKNGIIHIEQFASSSQTLAAFRAGTLDAAALTLDEALRLLEEKIPVRVILVMDFSNGADAILGRPGIKKFSGLAGKRIGVEKSAVGGYMIMRALEKHGMKPAQVQTVPIAFDAHENAFTSGQVDAVVTFEPVRTRLLKAGAVELFGSGEIPREITDVLVVREQTARKRFRVLKTLVDGWFAAIDYKEDNPEEAMSRLAGLMGIPVQAAKDGFMGLQLPSARVNMELLAGDNPALKKPMFMLIRVMHDGGMLKSPPPVGGILTGEFLPPAP